MTTRRILQVGGLVLALALAGLVYLALTGAFATRQGVKLSDGSTLFLEQVDFGKEHRFAVGTVRFNRLRSRLPSFLRSLLPSGYETKYTTPIDVLVPWFSRQDARGAWTNADCCGTELRIVDEHGCVFVQRSRSYARLGDISLWYTRLSAFPRRARQFKLVLQDGTNEVSFTVKRPPAFPEQSWTPEPLPISRTNEGLVVTLQQISIGRDSGGVTYAAPEFTLAENGRPTKRWTLGQTTYFDPLGNSSSSMLCPFEPVWKLQAQFRRTPEAPFATNDIWTLPDLTLPQPGTALTLNLTNRLRGATLELYGLSGAGEFVYSNRVVTTAKPLPGEPGNGISASGMIPNEKIKVRSAVPKLAIGVKGLAPSQRLLVFLTDPGGRKVAEGISTSSVGDFQFVQLKWPPTVPTATLNLAVDTPREVEFLVKPPQP
jgi:hypothetical protein